MESFKQTSADYVTRVYESPLDISASDWNQLLAGAEAPTPFMRHEYLCALHASGCASPETGWRPRFVTLWHGQQMVAACPMYIKSHSYGEYVFDWAWANAYADHGLAYYPKATVAVPFTPVPGSRLLAANATAQAALAQALLDECQSLGLSSLHLLLGSAQDLSTCQAAGLMTRQTVQFHWQNPSDALPPESKAWASFDEFLSGLQQEKRKKIRQERRKVTEAGVTLRCSEGPHISEADWAFLQRCYARTYMEHGNPPYLNPDFFEHIRQTMSNHWLVFIAERAGRPMAASLIGLDPERKVAYGRYWGAMERVDCLHFECCYYAPIEWCLQHGYHRFEGGAQGEHKMARALLPVNTYSAHWLAHPAFADAVERYLARESSHLNLYVQQLNDRTPIKKEGHRVRPSIDDNRIE